MKSKKIVLFLIISLILPLSCFNRGGKEASPVENGTAEDSSAVTADSTDLTPDNTMDTTSLYTINTSLGAIVIELYRDTPLHKANFEKLVAEHYYDNVLFHRVIYGFMIQTGDPLTKDSVNVDKFGQGGPDYTIPAEFRSNHTHKKGALAAARQGDIVNPLKESSGSQFYIVHDPEHCKHLDGEYTIFGEVVSGLEIVDKIASARVDRMDRPLKEIRIISIDPII